MNLRKSIAIVTACVLMTSASTVSLNATVVDGDQAAIAKAIAHKDRSVDDRKDDALRKPDKVLALAGIKPGMTVLDVNSGGGYYAEILSYAVGDAGKVYAHNGPVYWAFVKDSIGKRYDGRLPNVVETHGSEQVDIPAGTVDVAMSVLAYHDYYFNHPARTGKEDVPAALASIHRALKPGGIFMIMDHVAPEGSGEEAGDTLHRIDPRLVETQMKAAGFELSDTSDMFFNPDDDITGSPFDPSIRRKTNRFIHLYRKPV